MFPLISEFKPIENESKSEILYHFENRHISDLIFNTHYMLPMHVSVAMSFPSSCLV